MMHAIVPEGSEISPSDVYDTNTEWAQFLVYDCYDLYGEIIEKLDEKIFVEGENSGTVDGSFGYTTQNSSLDAHAALLNVDYIVTFTKVDESDGGNGYNITYLISDTFDFEWSKSTYDKDWRKI